MAQSVKHLLYKLWGVRLILQNSCVEWDVLTPACGLCAGRAQIGGSLSLMADQPCLPGELQAMRDPVSQSRLTTPQERHSNLTSGLHVCTYPHIGEHIHMWTHTHVNARTYEHMQMGKLRNKTKAVLAGMWACCGGCSLWN